MIHPQLQPTIPVLLVMLFAVTETTVSDAPPASETIERFVVSADAQTVQDTATTLIWQRSQSASGVTWKGAYDYCESLKITGVKGKWRLPKLAELQSLIVQATRPSQLHIDLKAFPNTAAEFFWTASANEQDVAAVFFDVSDFPTGLGQDKVLGNVRCVRGTLSPTYALPEFVSYHLTTIPRSSAR